MRVLSALLALMALSIGALASDRTHVSSTRCEVSETVADRPPDDPGASTFASPRATWYANADRTVWAWWWGKRSVGDYKVLWVSPRGERLKVAGQRVGDTSKRFVVDLPANSSRTYRTNALAFPTAGCWHVTATTRKEVLEFTVAIP